MESLEFIALDPELYAIRDPYGIAPDKTVYGYFWQGQRLYAVWFADACTPRACYWGKAQNAQHKQQIERALPTGDLHAHITRAAALRHDNARRRL